MRRERAFAIGVGMLLLLGVFVVQPSAGAAPSEANGPTISDVSFSNASAADRIDGRVYLWKSELRSINVTVDPAGDSARVRVCVEANDTGNGTDRWANCRNTLATRWNGSAEIPMDRWVVNQSGQRSIDITLREPDTGAVLDRHELSVVVVSRGGDLDSDGLVDERELEIGTGVDLKDTDKDGLLDGTEVKEYETDPLSNDTDADGLHDAQEINGNTNATVPDTDDDGLLDGPEVNEHGTDPTDADTDGDGLTDREEVEAYDTDPTRADTDGDGLTDHEEVEAYDTDPTRADTDGDLLDDDFEVSLGSDPTNELTTPLALIGLAGVALGLLALARDRGISIPSPRGGAGADGDVDPDAGDGGTGAGTGTDGAVTAPPADSPLLTDEDRVKQLLRENGGRLQQGEVVERTEWSKAKVSRLLSRMAEDGEIRKIALGRENLIALNGEEPEATKKPFEK